MAGQESRPATGPLAGVRVLEVASHVFVPAGTALLAEWGAEVVKVEHPRTGDAYRGLVTAGLHRTVHGVDVNFQYANRSKESIGIDLKSDAGHHLLLRLVAEADVFVTNFRPSALARLRLGVEDVRAANESVIYVRGTGQGVRGPDADDGAYDAAAYWARSGMAHRLMAAGSTPQAPPPAFGDFAAAMAVAAGVTTALYRRAAGGEPSVIDVSLLAMGMWQLQPDIIDGLVPRPEEEPPGAAAAPNPLVRYYRTSDDRHVSLVMVDADRHWRNLCEVIGSPDLVDDPRFVDAAARRRNHRACIAALDAVFATRTLDEWCRALVEATGVWAPVRRPDEVGGDPQVAANGYVVDADLGSGHFLPMVASPIRFDGGPAGVRRAPETGEHTEAVLLRSGADWDEIADLKARGVIT